MEDFERWRERKENKITFLLWTWRCSLWIGTLFGIMTSIGLIAGYFTTGLDTIATFVPFGITSLGAYITFLIFLLVWFLMNAFENQYFCLYQGEKELDYAQEGDPKIKQWKWLIKFEEKQHGKSEYLVKKIEEDKIKND